MTYTQTSDYKFADRNKGVTVQKVSEENVERTPETATAKLYQGVLITREELKSYLAFSFEKYGLASQLQMAINVIDCESSFDIFAYNEADEAFVKGGSYGIAQFTIPTFAACPGEYKNPFAQMDCMAYYWSLGQQRRWSCYNKLYVFQR